jgi:hypothetical protein
LDDYVLLSEVGDMSACKKKYIGDSLEYACKFWTRHLISSPSSGSLVIEVQREIYDFFEKHVLYWIEVLSILGHLGGAVYALNDIRKWYASVSFP